MDNNSYLPISVEGLIIFKAIGVMTNWLIFEQGLENLKYYITAKYYY